MRKGDGGYSGAVGRVLPWAVVGLCTLGYLCLAVRPDLVYHCSAPVFETSAAALDEHLSRPAGAIRYASLAMGQLLAWPTAGAAATAGMILGVCLAGGWALSPAGGSARRSGALLAAVPLVAIYSSYYAGIEVGLSMLVALAVAGGIERLPIRRQPVRVGAFLLAAAGTYWLAGSAMLAFAAIWAIREANARRLLSAAVGLAVAAVVPYLATHLDVFLGPAEAYTAPVVVYRKATLVAASIILWAWFPLLAAYPAAVRAGRRVWVRLRRRVRPSDGQAAGKTPPRPRASRLGRIARAALGTGTIVALGALAAWASLDTRQRALARIDQLASRRDWPGVLREARRLPLANVTSHVIFDVDRALFHTGRLPEEMFSYAHKVFMPGLTLYLGTRYIPSNALTCLKTSDLLFEWGHVNEAEHFAHEALEVLDNRPALLERQFMVYVAKGQPVAARTFATALAKQPFWAGRARRYLRLLDENRCPEALVEVRQALKHMPRLDSRPWPTVEQMLGLLLHRDPTNRMALEYLMANYLVRRQPKRVAENIRRLEALGVAEIPRHWEEAILMHAYQLRLKGRPRPIPLGGLRLRPGAQQRLERFLKARASFGPDEVAARKAMAEEFGDSYYYYHLFGMTSGGRE